MRESARARQALLAALLTSAFVTGFVGQGHWRIGARPASVAVSAAAVEVVGGAGTHQPAQVIVQVAVSNQGAGLITLDDAPATSPNAVPTALEPQDLEIDPDRTGQVNVSILLDCRSPAPLRLPRLRIAFPDGSRRTLPIAGDGRLTEACARSGPATRPLTTTLMGDADGLALHLSSPTARRIRVLAVRAGGVRIGVVGLPLTVGPADPTVRLSAPGTCAAAWMTAGLPGALTLDTDDGTGGTEATTGTAATLTVRIGQRLSDWLLATSCRTAVPGTGTGTGTGR